MNAFLTLEKIAKTTHYNIQTAELIASLPTDIRTASQAHDNHQLRQLLSGEHCFPDARTVTQLM